MRASLIAQIKDETVHGPTVAECAEKYLASPHRLLSTIGPVPTGLRDAGFTPTREKTFERLAMTGTSVPETVFQECANWRTLPTTFCDDSTERLVDDFADFGEHTSLR